jgi:hypothetical protein
MRTLALRGSVAVLALLVAWSCGGDDEADSEPTLDELPHLLVTTLCPELESCLGETATQRVFGEGGCAERLTIQLEDGDFAATQAAVEAGRVRYDGSKVQACLATIEGIGCGFQTRRTLLSDACNEVLEGSVELGGDCALDEDCAGVAFCKRDGNSCPGECSALLGAGETCSEDDDCAEGLACRNQTMRCEAPGRLGEPCGRVADANCAAGLACIGGDAAAGQAGECGDTEELFAAQLGEDCDLEEQVLCADDLACAVVLPLGTAPRFRCMARVQIGDDCTFGAPSQCPIGAYCNDVGLAAGDLEGVCAALPGKGETCNVGVDGQCADSLICESDGLCHAVGRLGDDCISDEGCASTHCDGTCKRPPSCSLGTEE